MSATGLVLLVICAVAGFAAARLMTAGFRQPYRTVRDWEHGLLYVDGRFAQVLPPGRYRVAGLREREVVTLPRVPRVARVAGIDVTSADRLSFRLSAAATYTVADPRAAHEGEHGERLRLLVSDALVRVAAARTLESVLAERAGLGEAALAVLAEPVCGCAVEAVTITAVTMPPELRRLYAEIERARLEGVAALERARGEQASLRALANAARMLKGNPDLMNLRLLQALAASGKGATLVLGRDALGPGGEPGGDAGPRAAER